MRKWVDDHMGWIVIFILFLMMLLISYYIFNTFVSVLDGNVTNITMRLYNGVGF